MISSEARLAEGLSRPTAVAPDPRVIPIVGALPKVMKDPLPFLSQAVREYGDVVLLGGFGSQQFYLVTHPHDIERVWKTHHRNYVRGSNFQLLQPLGGDGLFLTRGTPGACNGSSLRSLSSLVLCRLSSASQVS